MIRQMAMPQSPPPNNPRIIGYHTALALVVANMIGTGVFTTPGLQARDLDSGLALLALWLLGGMVALYDALSYGELAAAWSVPEAPS